MSATAPRSDAQPSCLATNLNWLLSQASHALVTELTAAFAEVGISPRGHCVLASARTGELTQKELTAAVGIDKTTMVVTLDELERAGLAERRPSTTDRRARVIAVTTAGEKAIAKGERVVAQIQGDALSCLPARDRDVFMRRSSLRLPGCCPAVPAGAVLHASDVSDGPLITVLPRRRPIVAPGKQHPHYKAHAGCSRVLVEPYGDCPYRHQHEAEYSSRQTQ